MLLNIA
ncbi:hypothetical protein AYI70_g8398, partial [Smittium culicis]